MYLIVLSMHHCFVKKPPALSNITISHFSPLINYHLPRSALIQTNSPFPSQAFSNCSNCHSTIHSKTKIIS